MKYIYILIIVINIIVLIKSQHIKPDCFGCLKEGDECIIEDNFKIGQCSSGLICANGANEDSLSKYTCIEPKRVGDSCFDSTSCDVGLLCNDLNQQCENIRFASINEQCSKDIDCSNSNEKDVICLNGVCKFKNNLNELDNSCEFDEHCPGGMVCIDESCRSAIQLNHSCSGSNVACEPLLFCSEITQICTSRYSLKINESCAFIKDFDVQCQLNLTCSEKGICTDPIRDISIKSSNPTLKNCSSIESNACEFGSYCDCLSGKCLENTFNSMSYIQEKTECIIKNKCRLVDNLHSKSSCYTKYCKHIDIEIHKNNQCGNTIYTENYKNIDSLQQNNNNAIHLKSSSYFSLFAILLPFLIKILLF